MTTISKQKLVKGVTAGIIGIAGATLLSVATTSDVEAATTGTVTYEPGATTVWDNSNTPSPIRYLVKDQTVNIEGQKQQAGETWYNIGNNEWVPGKYLNVTEDGNTAQAQASQAQAQQAAAATTTTTAAAATTAPAATTTTTTSSSSAVQTAINAAKSQIGVPYVWGGATAGVGLDCSGLTQYALAQAGVQVGHNTVAQESAGQKVSVSQLQAGDLVFWGSAGATYHVALYIGNNQYVAAPQPGQSVEIESISSYYMPSFGVRAL
ncbi:C40 family peptidase [Loigolactobacillus jiayinensis]|uniref:C40 family peptidase n=1 Tax=Loigolactobacillus jiayinensis TaxID=2486016 RepID=A0ABW1RB48_9LACO|nr:C40 family peptidase [Loigolactobacillus jiayinensis]